MSQLNSLVALQDKHMVFLPHVGFTLWRHTNSYIHVGLIRQADYYSIVKYFLDISLRFSDGHDKGKFGSLVLKKSQMELREEMKGQWGPFGLITHTIVWINFKLKMISLERKRNTVWLEYFNQWRVKDYLCILYQGYSDKHFGKGTRICVNAILKERYQCCLKGLGASSVRSHSVITKVRSL